MKTLRAILASLAITAVIAISMFVVGTNALANKNTVPIQNAPQTAGAVTVSDTIPNSQVTQLESLVQQYQNREKQYQQELQDAATKLTQANLQLTQQNQDLQQYQSLLIALQQRGLIRIDQNGQIYIARGGFSSGDN